MLLLLKLNADINQHNFDGYTALMYASARGHKDSVITLLKHGAVPNLADNDGYTALDLAQKNEHGDTVAILEEAMRKQPGSQPWTDRANDSEGPGRGGRD
jgi:serine/threonine-protein phosphatase 6 regulatory ankyrin repeat subunit B